MKPTVTGLGITNWPALALTMALMAGCATDVISPENPLPLIPDRSARIELGAMSRAEVRQTLGEPRFSSSYWRFDLFREQTEQSNVMVAVTPWPIPMAKLTDQLQRYTLVSYDAQDRASALATGVFRRPAPWRNVSPIRSDFRALHLRADNLLFFADPEGARLENLLVAPAVRDAYLRRARTLPTCTLVLGAGERGAGDRLSIDGAPVRRLPLRSANIWWLGRGSGSDGWLRDLDHPANAGVEQWLPVLVAVVLPAGQHSFTVSAGFLSGESEFQFSCAQATVTYLEISAATGMAGGKPPTPWRFQAMDAMPERFLHRPLVVLDDGKWLLDP